MAEAFDYYAMSCSSSSDLILCLPKLNTTICINMLYAITEVVLLLKYRYIIIYSDNSVVKSSGGTLLCPGNT